MVSQARAVVPAPPELQDWRSSVFPPLNVALSDKLTVLIFAFPLLFKYRKPVLPVQVEKVIVFKLVKVLPVLLKVTLGVEIEASQIGEAAIPVPVGIMPAIRPVVLVS